MPGIYNTENNRGLVLESMNEINTKKKAVKAVLMEDSVWLNIEMFIDSTPDLEDFFLRLLDILHASRINFYQAIQK